jgi:hypothetical protein
MNSNVEKLVLLVTGTLEAGAIEIILSFLFFLIGFWVFFMVRLNSGLRLLHTLQL